MRQRELNIELMRIFSMMLILLWHISGHLLPLLPSGVNHVEAPLNYFPCRPFCNNHKLFWRSSSRKVTYEDYLIMPVLHMFAKHYIFTERKWNKLERLSAIQQQPLVVYESLSASSLDCSHTRTLYEHLF